MSATAPVILQMQARLQAWETAADDKALFLNCYQLMTSNVLAAVEQHEFNDPVWVSRLLDHFAHYYFVALEAYERDPAVAPAIWQRAFTVTCAPNISALQKLLLGVNAHINYDLVFTLVDLLQPEWPQLSDAQRAARYADHCHVNAVIGRTIDAVQDQVLEPAMPLMDLVDKLLGPMDEALISRLITQWRDQVWLNAVSLLNTGAAPEQAQLHRHIEQSALITAGLICREGGRQNDPS